MTHGEHSFFFPLIYYTFFFQAFSMKINWMKHAFSKHSWSTWWIVEHEGSNTKSLKVGAGNVQKTLGLQVFLPMVCCCSWNMWKQLREGSEMEPPTASCFHGMEVLLKRRFSHSKGFSYRATWTVISQPGLEPHSLKSRLMCVGSLVGYPFHT